MSIIARLAPLFLAASVAHAQTATSIGLRGDATSPEPVNPVVVVVDPTGAGDFTSVAAALQATGNGALLLVRSGTYSGAAAIDGNGVTLQADAGAQVELLQPLTVRGVPAGHGVVVSGIVLSAGFDVDDCVGPVRFDACVVPPPTTLASPPPGTMYWEWPNCGIGLSDQNVRNSAAVVFVDCILHGRDGEQVHTDGAPGEHGLLVDDSTVALYGTTLRGGAGRPAISPGHYPVASGAGGDGLRVIGPASVVRYCGLDAIGGLGGTFTPGGNGSFGVTFGCDGIPVRADAGATVDECPVDDLGFSVPAVARADQSPWYTIDAPAGTPIFLMVSARQDWRTFAPASGVLHLGGRTKLVPLGPMPPTGQLSRPLPVPGPASVLGHVRLELQVYAQIGGVERYSDPRTVVVVDPGL